MLIRLLIILFALTAAFLPQLSQAAAPEQVHILLDISGNMQKFDTDLARIAALKDLINKLPNGSRVGIWTYAKQVNMLVAPGTVNNEWRTRAQQSISKLRGYGPYANLTKATESATYAWRTTTATSARKLVIFTASGVKPSLSSTENQTSRNNLLNNVLPNLKKSGVNIYTLAFTSQADLPLLQQLAKDSNGNYFQASGSDDLAAAFMHLNQALKNNSTAAQVATPEVSVSPAPAQTESLVETTPVVTVDTTKPVETTTKNNTASIAKSASEPQPLFTVPSQSVAEIAAAANAPAEKTPAAVESEEAKIAAESEAAADEVRNSLNNAEEELTQLLSEFASMSKDEKAQAPALATKNQALKEPLVITLNDGSVLVTPDQTKARDAGYVEPEQAPLETSNVADEFASLSEPATTPATEIAPAVMPETLFDSQALEHPADKGWIESKSQGDVWALILTVLVFINLGIIIMLIVGRFVWLAYTKKKQQTQTCGLDLGTKTETESA